MAEFITKCSQCNSDLQVQDEWIGTEVECPACHNSFVITKPAPPSVIVNSGTANVQGLPGLPPNGQGLPPNGQNLPPNGKNCPFCGNIIHIQATSCNFCRRSLNGAQNSYPGNFGGNKNSKWRKVITSPYFYIAALALFAMFCSGIFCVLHDNYYISHLHLEERYKAYCSDMGQSSDFSPICYVADNAASFIRGLFLCFGDAVLNDNSRLMNKVLFRYGVTGENNREAICKTIDIWYNAKKQNAYNEGRYLDY